MKRSTTIDQTGTTAILRCIRAVAPLLVLAGALTLTGCGDSTKRALGLTKTAPDEFAVVSRAPLSQPPDYGLRPPRPGALSPSRVTPSQQAKAGLFGSTAATGSAATGNNSANRPAGSPSAAPRTVVTTTTPGEAALLSKAGATNADPNIRAEIDRESAVLAQADRNFIQELLDYTPDRAELVDAPAEAKRLRENEALGKPVTEGRTPTIERKDRGLLEGIF
ncbi:MAG: DUF3035 domain-containing protein [Alphaproteobacteria bacterium]|jgi:hypothetical protein